MLNEGLPLANMTEKLLLYSRRQEEMITLGEAASFILWCLDFVHLSEKLSQFRSFHRGRECKTFESSMNEEQDEKIKSCGSKIQEMIIIADGFKKQFVEVTKQGDLPKWKEISKS